MQLPGGILVNTTLRRDFTFREFTGGFELMLNAQTYPELNHVERVTQVLCNALASIGGQQVSEELISGLSVGDRQFLMRQLAVHMDDRPVWLTAVCHHCAEKFDVSFRQSELPVKPAGEGYPSRDIEVSLGMISVSVPTGNDQRAISGITDHQKALRTLIARLVKIKGRRPGLKPENLTAEDIEKIESTSEAMSPEIATEVLAVCPHCEAQNRLTATPYSCFEKSPDTLFNEVHAIAMHYHWREQDILDLPRARRQKYLQLIDRSRGMAAHSHVKQEGHNGRLF
ncbi:MAG: hypothetical protein MRK00_14710 [Nitrosomonas sp.]|nr:hypothetical protein [Nitrosomonas sp.]